MALVGKRTAGLCLCLCLSCVVARQRTHCRRGGHRHRHRAPHVDGAAPQNLTGSTLAPLQDAESLFDGLLEHLGGGGKRPGKAAIERVTVAEDTPRRLVVTVTYSGLAEATLSGEVRAANRRTLAPHRSPAGDADRSERPGHDRLRTARIAGTRSARPVGLAADRRDAAGPRHADRVAQLRPLQGLDREARPRQRRPQRRRPADRHRRAPRPATRLRRAAEDRGAHGRDDREAGLGDGRSLSTAVFEAGDRDDVARVRRGSARL